MVAHSKTKQHVTVNKVNFDFMLTLQLHYLLWTLRSGLEK